MPRKVGLWIDHRKTVLVALEGKNVSTRTLLSNVGKKVRVKGGAPSGTPYGAQDATYEARRDRRYDKHLSEYYDTVVSGIGKADRILVMGPGQAKTDLRKRLEDSGFDEARLTVKATDKLTDAQIVEKVKAYYGYPTRATF